MPLQRWDIVDQRGSDPVDCSRRQSTTATGEVTGNKATIPLEHHAGRRTCRLPRCLIIDFTVICLGCRSINNVVVPLGVLLYFHACEGPGGNALGPVAVRTPSGIQLADKDSWKIGLDVDVLDEVP